MSRCNSPSDKRTRKPLDHTSVTNPTIRGPAWLYYTICPHITGREPNDFRKTLGGVALLHHLIYPPELGCHVDESLALHATPLAGTTLLHLCVDNDEIEIARWLIDRGANVNVKAAIDADGFGGHTPLFGCVVSQPYRVGLRKDDAFARLLLDQEADPNVRASLLKRLRFVADETMHEYRDVTPLAASGSTISTG